MRNSSTKPRLTAKVGSGKIGSIITMIVTVSIGTHFSVSSRST